MAKSKDQRSGPLLGSLQPGTRKAPPGGFLERLPVAVVQTLHSLLLRPLNINDAPRSVLRLHSGVMPTWLPQIFRSRGILSGTSFSSPIEQLSSSVLQIGCSSADLSPNI